MSKQDRYKFRIQDRNGIYQYVDLGKEMPDMSYQVNDIAELENRSANISMTVKLPKTYDNCKIFDLLQIPENATRYPYKRHYCYLEANGHTLAGKSSYIKILRATHLNFEVQIVSGIADVFSTMKESPMSDIDLGRFSRLSDHSFIKGIRNDDYVIPVATYQKKSETVKSISINGGGAYIFPAAYVANAMKKIAAKHGYELRHNLEGKWEDLAVSVCTLKPDENSGDDFNFRAESKNSNFDITKNIVHDYMYGTLFNPADIKEDGREALELDGQNSLFTYIARFKGSMNVKFYLKMVVNEIYTDSSTTELYSFIRKNGDYIVKKSVSPIMQGSSFELNIEHLIEFEKGDEFQFGLYSGIPIEKTLRLTGVLSELNLQSSNVMVDEDIVPVGGSCAVAPNLGFASQFDFFKAVCQALGLTVNVIENKKIIEAYTLNKLYENKKYVHDWTEYMNPPTMEIKYNIRNYAQKNYISLQENANDKFTDKGLLEVDDSTLDKSKDMFTIPFESGLDKDANRMSIFGGDDPFLTILPAITAANIPLIQETQEEKSIVAEFSEGKPHLLKISRFIIPYQGVSRTCYLARHFTAQSMVDEFYTELKNRMLKNARTVTADFILPEKEIERYNSLTESGTSGAFNPVYLQISGKHYYVNNISNYISGKPCEVELIKM